jgi:phosphomannomutase/phosphoglucomutase
VVSLITIIATTALAAGIVAVVALYSLDRSAELQDQARYEAKAVAAAVDQRVQSRRQSLLALAQSSEVASALADGRRDRLDALQTRYRAVFPDASSVLIVAPNHLRARPKADPPVGYALLEMVRGFKGDVAVEVHRPGKPNAQLNMVASVRRDGQLVGHVIAMYPASLLADNIAVGDGQPWELVQTSGDTKATVARNAGDISGQFTVTAPIQSAPWSVRLVPKEPSGFLTGGSVTRLVITTAGGGLIIVLVSLLAGRRLVQAIRSDAAEFQRLVSDTAQGQPGTDYVAVSPEIEPFLHEAVAIAQQPAPVAAVSGDDKGVSEPVERHSSAPDQQDDATEELLADPEPPPTSGDPDAALDFTLTEPSAAEPLGDDGDLVTVDPSILRAYDIRGIVGETLTPAVMRSLGQALGSEASDHGQETVVVGYDGRHSSPELAKALIEGLTRAGRDVIDIGAVPTPMVYFATHYLETGAGIMVTGSHNPPAYNGLKMVIGGETLSGNQIKALGGRLEAGDLVEGKGSHQQRDLSAAYRDRITTDVHLERSIRIVVDAGNGITGATAPAIYQALGCDVLDLFCEVDGDFPNHHPDPSLPENLQTLSETVTKTGADLGIAFDGDGDRLGVVDNNGKIIWADRQLMLFARQVLAQQPGSDIIFDVKCTNRLPELITENAGFPVMWKTGHSLIKGKLYESGAPLAGEMSGHFFFNDRWYGFDDGIYAGARLLEILAADTRSASEVFADLPEGLTTPELRVDLAEGEADPIIEALVSRAESMGATRVSTIDGLRVDFPDGWGLVRASNTQPCLVLRFEGDDQTALERIQGLFRDRLTEVQPTIELPF